MVSSAHAQVSGQVSWTMPVAGQPTFTLESAVSPDVCQQVNLKGRGDNGILRKAQCYGESETALTVVISKEPEQLEVTLGADKVDTGEVPSDPMAAAWLTPPGASAEGPAQGGSDTLGYLDAGGAALRYVEFSAKVGETSAATSVTLKNQTEEPVSFTSMQATAPFAVSGTTCTGTLSPGQTCSVSITFTPTEAKSYDAGSYRLTPMTAAGALNVLTLIGLGSEASASAFTIVPAWSHTFARLDDGKWYAMGTNTYGQLGVGDNTARTTLTPVPSLDGAVERVAGASHGFARFADGTWRTAGYNSSAELYLGWAAGYSVPTLTVVPALQGATQVVVATDRTFAKLADGRWIAAGYNRWGRLGTPGVSSPQNFAEVPEIAGAVRVVASELDTYAKMPNGTWKGTGSNYYGELGLGHTDQVDSFTDIPGLAGAKDVAAGSEFMFAQLPNNSWVAAGYNANGQLGLGDTVDRTTLTPVAALNGATQVKAGYWAAYAKLANGTWAATGQNGYGELGLGDTTSPASFTHIPALDGASEVKIAEYVAFAKLANGKWAAAGNNWYGALLVGDDVDRASFTEVALP